MKDTVNQTGFQVDLNDVRTGEQPDKVNQNQCCNPKGEQHFFCAFFQRQKFKIISAPEKKTGDDKKDSRMVIKCLSKS